MRTLMELVRQLGAASLAGIAAGIVVGGLLGRVAMRVAGFASRPELAGTLTSNGNRVGDITVGGTTALVVFVGVIAGIGGGVLFASAEPWLRPRGRWTGPIFGIGLLAALGFTVIDPGNIDFRRFGSASLNVVLFAALFVVFGVLIAWLFDRIQGSIGGTTPLARGLKVAAWLAAVLAVVIGMGTAVAFGGLDDPAPAAQFAAAVLIPPVVRWRRLPPVIAYAAFAVPVILGGARTLDGLRQLLG